MPLTLKDALARVRRKSDDELEREARVLVKRENAAEALRETNAASRQRANEKHTEREQRMQQELAATYGEALASKVKWTGYWVIDDGDLAFAFTRDELEAGRLLLIRAGIGVPPARGVHGSLLARKFPTLAGVNPTRKEVFEAKQARSR